MPAHMAPTAMATRIISSDVQRAGERDAARRRRAATSAASAVLAVDADVEQVHPEADGHRDGGQVVVVAVLMIARIATAACRRLLGCERLCR